MSSVIRIINEQDRLAVLEMMREFYSSPAVYTSGSDKIFSNDIDNCINNTPFLEGYVFDGPKGIQGYAMIAKSFSTEFGKPCIWVEDLYIKEAFRGSGIGNDFLTFLTSKYQNCIFRLEVEEDNEQAIKLYKKFGFTVLPYMEMKK